MSSRIAKLINKTHQGIPLLVLDGTSNKTVTIPPKGPKGFVLLAEDVLTDQTQRLKAQGKIEIR